jgi:Transcriptional regulators
MKAGRNPTTSDIAARALVSQSTVSMILNHSDKGSFSAETVQRVLKAAEEVGYKFRPRQDKSQFRFQKNTILVLCSVPSNPYYSALVQAVEQEASKRDLSTIICNTYRDIEKEQEYLSLIQSSNISGIVFTFVPQSCKLVEEISGQIPVIVIGDRNANVKVDTVEIDSVNSGRLIAKHLIQLGHRHIAFISTTLKEDIAVRLKRLEGVRETFSMLCPEGSVTVQSETVSPQRDLNTPLVELSVGCELTNACLADKKITAFVAVNDMVAYGVLKAIHENGYAVPKDYSVCGFDNIFPSDFSSVSLTSVEHYISEKGHHAVEILCNRLNSGTAGVKSITRIEYQPDLIVRGSTGKPRHK